MPRTQILFPSTAPECHEQGRQAGTMAGLAPPGCVTLSGSRATAHTMPDEVLGIHANLIEHLSAHAVRDPGGMIAAWSDSPGRVGISASHREKARAEADVPSHVSDR